MNLLDMAARQGGDALDPLLESIALGETPLAPLIDRPRLTVRLDERPRRHIWHPTSPARHPWLDRLLESFGRDPAAVPVEVTALASCQRDGRVREQAVRAMIARPTPALMPFLVLRCGDWVEPVREAARSAVARLLADHPERYLPAAVPIAAHTAARHRGGWAMQRVLVATAVAFEQVAPFLLSSRNPVARRLAYDVGAERGAWSRDDLLRFALTEPDPLVRLRAAEAVVRSAAEAVVQSAAEVVVQSGAAEAAVQGDAAAAGVQGDAVAAVQGDAAAAVQGDAALRALAGSRFSQVRLLALVGLAGLGLDGDVAAAVDDPAPLVRAYARTRVPDPVAHYRAAVAARPRPSVIAGLGEVGGYADEALLAPLLHHLDPPVRAAAVRALTMIDSVAVEALVPLLRDPAAAVVREAATALRPYRRRLPAELMWRLLADSRAEVRRGAYRVIRSWDPVSRLRAALLLAGDADPELARRGRSDALRPEFLLPAERAELVVLAERIGPEVADRVRAVPTG